MIYLLFGDNDFLKEQRLSEIIGKKVDTVERLDGAGVTMADLQDILRGQTLFTPERLVIITNLSESEAWADLATVAEDAKTETKLVLVEQSIDKRTKTYKWLKKNAKVEEFKAWSDRDKGVAIKWLVERAKAVYGFKLTANQATTIVERLGFDQMILDSLLRQLSLAERVDDQLIDLMVPLPKSQNVFKLLEMTLKRQRKEVRDIIRYLELHDGADGAYQTIGLLVSQLVTLNALVLGAKTQEIIKDLGVHPFAVQQSQGLARNLTVADLRVINQALAEADLLMKTTNTNPWLLVETALVKIMNR